MSINKTIVNLLPPGLFYKENYIGTKEHDEFWNILQRPNFKWDDQPQRRQVKQYGCLYNYRNQNFDLDKIDPIPNWLKPLIRKLFLDRIYNVEPNHVIINKYKQNGNRNWSIPPHIDSPEFFGPIITSITLGNSCIVEFCKAHHEKSELYCHKIEPKSLYIMTGESRFKYYHRIPDKKYNKPLNHNLNSEGNIRISLTFRTIPK